MYKYITIVLITLLLAGCGGGGSGTTIDPGNHSNPPAKTVAGYWQLNAMGSVPDGWPVSVQISIASAVESRNAAVFIDGQMAVDLGKQSFKLSHSDTEETPATRYYWSYDVYSSDTAPIPVVTFLYYKRGTGDEITFTLSNGNGSYTEVIYSATKVT